MTAPQPPLGTEQANAQPLNLEQHGAMSQEGEGASAAAASGGTGGAGAAGAAHWMRWHETRRRGRPKLLSSASYVRRWVDPRSAAAAGGGAAAAEAERQRQAEQQQQLQGELMAAPIGVRN